MIGSEIECCGRLRQGWHSHQADRVANRSGQRWLRGQVSLWQLLRLIELQIRWKFDKVVM